MISWCSLFFHLSILGGVHSDLFLHNPRGSNNRMNEANTNSNNNNRLFASQNNGKGGYCWGPPLSYYEGSRLLIEWTGGHGCGNSKTQCNYVIQYMCGAADAPAGQRIRDGFGTDTVPATIAGTEATDANGELLYGMHESLQYYSDCTTRDRNMGLYIADREVEGGLDQSRRSALYTRQNNGNKNGLECPEERDYYPYWHPSPWKDIAVLVDNTEYCSFYQAQSQNVIGKNQCVNTTNQQAISPNNGVECSATPGATWAQVPSHNIPPPYCGPNLFTRPNHYGMAPNGRMSSYEWTLPTAIQEPCIGLGNCNCALRLRYNVTSGDVGTYSKSPAAGFLDWNANGAASPLKNDPRVLQSTKVYQLVADTTQFGRVFQDRSHVFHIKPRPLAVPSGAIIHNLNVKGKRGNIVQTFPAVEYGFVPDPLTVVTGEYVHFQWTGCDTNPAFNAGEGVMGTDRTNIVQIADLGLNYPATNDWLAANTPLFPNETTRSSFITLNQQGCLTLEELLVKHNGVKNDIENDVQNCLKLNAASQYFDGGLQQMNVVGSFYYMSTRNNNFSNRDHKGQITVVAPGQTTSDFPTSSFTQGGTGTGTGTGTEGTETGNADESTASELIVHMVFIVVLLMQF